MTTAISEGVTSSSLRSGSSRPPGWRRTALAAALVVIASAIVGIGTGVYAARHGVVVGPEPGPDPYPDAAQAVVVLGDSFAAGEGAHQFFADSGECHRTWTAWGYLVAVDYRTRLLDSACSGAVIDDIDPTGDGSPPAVPATYGTTAPEVSLQRTRRPQLDVLRGAAGVNAVVVQVSGNDAGFGDLVAACIRARLFGSCANDDPTWTANLRRTAPRLTDLYRKVKAEADTKDAPVFAMDYPDPFGPRYCSAAIVGRTDWRYLKDDFIPRLDAMVADAAKAAGINLVPLRDTFRGFGLCELPLGQAALNTISYLNGLPRHDSFHPNEIGHLLMARRLEAELATHGIALPPTRQALRASPEAAAPSGATDACSVTATTAGEYSVTLTAEQLQDLVIADARPNSSACVAVDAGSGMPATADGDGQLEIRLPSAPITVVVTYEAAGGAWQQERYSRGS